MSEKINVVEMNQITKKFGTFTANDQIDFHVRRGEVHALLGENGAGKSTLMNMLGGLSEPTSGEILIKGEPVNLNSPETAAEHGIGMVHQHFMLVDKFTVTENIMLGNEEHRFGYIDHKTAEKHVEELSNRYGLSVDPHARIENISVGMQQRTEILKALYKGVDTLILDEPTAVLTPQEIDELMKIIRSLAAEGRSVIIITHKLDEIKQVADRCTVIRRGKKTGTVNVKETTQQQLADMMVGRSVSFKVDKKPAQPGEVVLDVDRLVVEDSRGLQAVKEAGINIRRGEILGLAGIDGNGQSEFIQAIAGLNPPVSGSIKLLGKEISGLSPRAITESGFAHIPEDRHRFGLILDLSLEKNMVLQTYYKEPFSKKGFINDRAIKDYALRLIDEFDVRTSSEENLASELSGGNQQKAIIAREIDRDPDLLIAAQPTRGLDVGAIEYIHKRLIEQRDNDKAVLLMSFELDEILDVSDRIAVMYGGKIVAVVDAEETNEQELGLLMAGVPLEKARKEVAGEELKERVES